VGFNGQTYDNDVRRYFNGRLWYYLTKAEQNVNEAVRLAKRDTSNQYGEGNSMESATVLSCTDAVYLYPAGWGS
jgi:hypothetical protein